MKDCCNDISCHPMSSYSSIDSHTPTDTLGKTNQKNMQFISHSFIKKLNLKQMFFVNSHKIIIIIKVSS